MRKKKLLAALLALVMVVTLLPITALAAGAEMVTVWREITDLSKITEDTNIKIVCFEGSRAVALYGYVDGTAITDQWQVTILEDGTFDIDTLKNEGKGADTCTTWVISPDGDKFNIKSAASSYYINITEYTTEYNGGKRVPLAAQPQALTVTEVDGGVNISVNIDGTDYYINHNAQFYVQPTPVTLKLFAETQEAVKEPEFPDHEAGKPVDHTAYYPESGKTQGQPFDSGTGGSANFRIPSLITLDNGDLMAAIDARWNTFADAGGLDTIISISHDNGATWEYKYVNYFNDSADVFNDKATAFIDPEIIQADDGTIYVLADLFAGGTALGGAQQKPSADTDGYEEIDGEQRLVLYSSPVAGSQNDYSYYVGDFAEDGFAPVIAKDDSSKTAVYYVDHWYYIYDDNKEPVVSKQLGKNEYIHDNVFFWNDGIDMEKEAVQLHVRAADYLWMIKSKDEGVTWSVPQILNPQVRQNEESGSQFYGNGPGRGLITEDGHIMFTAYTWGSRLNGDGHTSVIYSKDGENWSRSSDVAAQSSEGAMVEVDGTVYLFSRHGTVSYGSEGEKWTQKDSLWPQKDGVKTYNSCQIDAITYSRKIDGKTAILLSGPSGDGNKRINGKIWVGLVDNETKSIEWKYVYSVNDNDESYEYSGITEMPNGDIAVLYESIISGYKIIFKTISIDDIAPDAELTYALTEPTEADLPDDLVTITCDNDEHSGSESATYGIKDITDENKGVDIGEVADIDGVPTVTVTVRANLYVNKFTQETGVTHNLANNGEQEKTFTMTFDKMTGEWNVADEAAPVTFTVHCDTTPQTPVIPPAVTSPAGDDTELPDDDVPMNPTPDDDTDIEDGDTPLAPAPEDKGDTDIPDSDTPLDSTPKTGDTSIAVAVLWSIFSLSALGFVWVILSMKKSGKHSK